MMSRDKDLLRLQNLADLLLDHRLSQLQIAEGKRAESLAAIARLSPPPIPAEGLEGAAGAIAALAYQRWAEARRAELDQSLARQTIEWQQARDAARMAFGRTAALNGLVAKLGLKPKT